jgi:hypothetical protein
MRPGSASNLIIALITVSGLQLPNRADEPTRISFNRDIRPILSNNCFFCHGQDNANRKAELRLDTEEGQRANHVVVPGSLDESLLIERILSTVPDVVMPPPDSNKALSTKDKELLKRWVVEGAAFEKHWSWIAPKRTQPGKSPSPNPIDAFILKKLDEQGLKPSPEADRTTLIRRVTLDLTGLPPTLEEVDNFLSDKSETAYEKVVDRLLQSPHFGERMALPWLDAARYADTHGYQKDNHRSMWPWRDWVVNAINQNMPFDQFTIEQLAGDLLPNANDLQRIATGFHRNHRINAEAGSIEEEYLAEYAADRLDTTATVWLGLTVGCARCHDHKFDPITQKEYFQLFAFFNNIDEKGVDGVGPSPTPQMTVSVPGLDAELARQRVRVAELGNRLAERADELRQDRLAWEERVSAILDTAMSDTLWIVPEPTEQMSANKMNFTVLADRSVLVHGDNPLNDVQSIRVPIESGWTRAIRLEALPHESLNQAAFARSFDGSFVLSGFEVELNERDQAARKLEIRSAIAASSRLSWSVAGCLDQNTNTGWSTDPNLPANQHRALFLLDQSIEGKPGSYLTLRLRYEAKEEQSIIGRFRFALSSSDQPVLESDDWFPSSLVEAVRVLPGHRTAEQQQQLVDVFQRLSTDTLLKTLRWEREEAEQHEKELLERSTVNIMVMKELDTPRDTFIHLRGAYDKPGERVVASTPASLPEIEKKRLLNRLDLARWIVDRNHPLTARVAVNRYWQMYFGTGLVKTTEDFGTQGEWPSHPELLDWLASEFIDSNWDVKAMQRLMVLSQTYRQSSKTNPRALELDPENRWLSHGPRFRLAAHLLRDQALSVSGLLVPALGGPPVKPYQPAGLWEGVAGINSNTTRYRQDTGSSLYRRSIYTYWKRAVPPPSMMIFDTADREVCSVKRRLTNTPLQALTMLNDPTYVETARALASQSMGLSSQFESDADVTQWIFRRILARSPDAAENQQLQGSLVNYRVHFQRLPSAAQELIHVGESPVDAGRDAIELAARTTLVSLILNLDETLTKE